MRVFAQHHHNHPNPWDSAPPWAIELGFMVSLVIGNTESIMAAIDDLKTATAAFIQEGTSDIAALVAQINTQANQDPAIVALTQQVTDATTAMHKAFTDATGVPLPPPTPTP
jgi:hypothetical protein